jgi:hypothetical protein
MSRLAAIFDDADGDGVLDYGETVDASGRKRAGKGGRESAGHSRQGVADERAVRERASDPSRP